MKLSRIPITTGLMIAIVMMFAAQVLSGGSQNDHVLIRMGALVPGIFARGDYWRLLAAMFLHIGLFHLLLNLWALYQLGGVFEMMFGRARFLATYFASGIVASLVSATFIKGIGAGASGAIFGVLGALILGIRRSPRWRSQPWTGAFTQQLVVWAVINIVIGFTPGFRIDNAAHLGGLGAGLILGLLPHRTPPPPPAGEVIAAETSDSEL